MQDGQFDEFPVEDSEQESVSIPMKPLVDSAGVLVEDSLKGLLTRNKVPTASWVMATILLIKPLQ